MTRKTSAMMRIERARTRFAPFSCIFISIAEMPIASTMHTSSAVVVVAIIHATSALRRRGVGAARRGGMSERRTRRDETRTRLREERKETRGRAWRAGAPYLCAVRLVVILEQFVLRSFYPHIRF